MILMYPKTCDLILKTYHCSKVFDLQGLIRWAPLVTTAMDLVWPLLRQVARVCARRVDMLAQLMVLKSHVAQVRRRAVQCFCFQNQTKLVSDIFIQKGVFQIQDHENKLFSG
jgi:hypothetical protein